LIIEITGDSSKCQAFINVLEPFGVKELVQSGILAMGRGSKSISDNVSK
jgi:acetolactate synthase-1/3 small subunit